MLELNYNYQDSLIDKVKITETTFTFYIDLYSIFYPSKPKIKISFSLKNDYNICKTWTEHLYQIFNNQENYLGARLDGINIQKMDLNPELFLCAIECDNMNKLDFQILNFKETEIKKEIYIDRELINICSQILKESLSVEEWIEIECDDMFQSENYEGGFVAEAREFVFSYFGDKEYWFNLSLEQAREIVQGQKTKVFGVAVEYFDV